MIPFIIVIVVIVRIITTVREHQGRGKGTIRRLQRLRITKVQGLIANNFIDSKHLFVKLNRQLPSVMLVNGIDVNKAVRFTEANLGNNITTVYKHKQYDFSEQQIIFNMLIIVTNDNRVIEIGSSYVELLYTAEQASWADYMAKELAAFRLNDTEKPVAKAVCIRGFAGYMNENITV